MQFFFLVSVKRLYNEFSFKTVLLRLKCWKRLICNEKFIACLKIFMLLQSSKMFIPKITLTLTCIPYIASILQFLSNFTVYFP